MNRSDLTIRELQTNLPWTIRYSEDFRKTPLAHKDFAHALTHVSKAAGRLHELVDKMDHNSAVADDTAQLSGTKATYAKYVADLVVCAIRMANTFPSGVIDLQREVECRIEEKNDVILPRGKREENYQNSRGIK
jgi:hypothetical protein